MRVANGFKVDVGDVTMVNVGSRESSVLHGVDDVLRNVCAIQCLDQRGVDGARGPLSGVEGTDIENKLVLAQEILQKKVKQGRHVVFLGKNMLIAASTSTDEYGFCGRSTCPVVSRLVSTMENLQ